MTTIATITILWAISAPPTPTPEGDLATRLTGIIGEQAKLRETKHFAIAYDTTTETLSALTARLEATHTFVERYCEGLGLAVQASTGPLGVLLFDDYGDYTAHCNKHGVSSTTAAGFYDQQTNLATFVNTFNTPQLKGINEEIQKLQQHLKGLAKGSSSRDKNTRRDFLRRNLTILGNQRDAIVKQFNRFVIQHEVAHQLLFNLGVHVFGADNPIWLLEGMACLFEVPQVRSRQSVGRTNHMRLADLRDALAVKLDRRKITDDGFAQAVESGRIIPLSRLISDPDVFAAAGSNLIATYAQAWALVFYLNRTQRESFADYLTEVGKRKRGVNVAVHQEIELFTKHFGPPDDAFHRSWIDYMVKLRLDRREAGR